MSVRFSRVKLVSKDKAAVFLVSGLPRSQEDLKGWKAFDSFREGSVADAIAYVETFEYGDGEQIDASPEEVAYFYMRSEKRPDFVDTRAKKLSESKFSVRV